MITNTGPNDYEKAMIIIDEPVKLCPVDGHYLFAMPGSDGRAVCMLCRGAAYEIVMQSDAAAYRESKKVEVINEQEAV